MIANIFKGILIGIGGIIPGLSGAVLAMVLGLYEDMIFAVANFFKDIKKNFIFLFPLLIGIAIGFILFSNIQRFLLQSYPFYTMLIIVGLIIGTIPTLVKNSNIKKFKLSYLGIFAITLFIGLFISYIGEPDIHIENQIIQMNFSNILNLIIIGFIMAGSHIIPGISGTVILILLGSYGIMLNAIANLKSIFVITSYTENFDVILYNIIVIIPIVIGLLIGAILFSKLMNYLMEHFYTLTYCAIIGFVIGSIPSIVPAIDYKSQQTFTGIILLLISAIISYKFSFGIEKG